MEVKSSQHNTRIGILNEDVTDEIIGAAIEVHRLLGPGLLESVYEECFCRELTLHGIPHRRQVTVPIIYKGTALDCDYRIDVLVRDTVIVELKAVEKLLPVYTAQLLTYMKLTSVRVGLLFNFNVSRLIDGMIRRVL